MQDRKKFVAASEFAPAAFAPTFEALTNQLNLPQVKHIKIFYYRQRVTASCKAFGYSFGSSGNCLAEALLELSSKVHLFKLKQEE